MKSTKGRTAGILGWVLFLIATSLPQQARANVILPAVNDATVQPGGPRSGVNGKQFFNMEGSANGTFASFGILDFQSSPTSVQLISLTLDLTQVNAAFTHNGALLFYLSTDTTTNIEPGVSPLIYRVPDTPTGLGAQLSPAFLLGAASFTQTSDGTVETFSFSPSAAAVTYVDNQLAVGGRIRLIIAPADSTVAATYAGFSNSQFAGPRLTLVTPAPEPGTVGGAFLGLLGCAVGIRRTHGRRFIVSKIWR